MPPTYPIPIAPTAVPYPPTPAPPKNLPPNFLEGYLDAINQLLEQSGMVNRSYDVAPFVPPPYDFYNPNAGMQVGAQEVPNMAYMKYIIDKYYADNFPGQRSPFPPTSDLGQAVGAQEFPIKRYGPNDLFQQNTQQYVTQAYRHIMNEKKANYLANQNPFNAGLVPNPLMPQLRAGINPYTGQSAQQRINLTPGNNLPPRPHAPNQKDAAGSKYKPQPSPSFPVPKFPPFPKFPQPQPSRPSNPSRPTLPVPKLPIIEQMPTRPPGQRDEKNESIRENAGPAPRKASPALASVRKDKKPTLNSYIPRYERD